MDDTEMVKVKMTVKGLKNEREKETQLPLQRYATQKTVGHKAFYVHDKTDSTAKVIVFQPENQFSTNSNRGYMKQIAIGASQQLSHPLSFFSFSPCLRCLSPNCEQEHQSKWQFIFFCMNLFSLSKRKESK